MQGDMKHVKDPKAIGVLIKVVSYLTGRVAYYGWPLSSTLAACADTAVRRKRSSERESALPNPKKFLISVGS